MIELDLEKVAKSLKSSDELLINEVAEWRARRSELPGLLAKLTPEQVEAVRKVSSGESSCFDMEGELGFKSYVGPDVSTMTEVLSILGFKVSYSHSASWHNERMYIDPDKAIRDAAILYDIRKWARLASL